MHRSKERKNLFVVGLTPALILGVGFVFLPLVAEAGPAGTKLWGILCDIADWAYTFALVIGIIYAVVAAYKYMSSGGDTSKVSEAHKTLTYAAIGIGVAILSGGVPSIVASLLGETVTACS